jgi:hypothetical protein
MRKNRGLDVSPTDVFRGRYGSRFVLPGAITAEGHTGHGGLNSLEDML